MGPEFGAEGGEWEVVEGVEAGDWGHGAKRRMEGKGLCWRCAVALADLIRFSVVARYYYCLLSTSTGCRRV